MTRAFSILLGLVMLWGAFAPGTARAQAGMVGSELTVCVQRDAPGLTAARLFATPSGFDCRTPQSHFGAGDYWVMSGAVPDAPYPTRLTVRSASMWQDRATLYALYPGGRIVEIPTDGPSATRNIQLGAIIQFWLPHGEQAPLRLLWHVEGSANLRGIVLAPTIAAAGQSARSDVLLGAMYSAFAGVCAALLLYNLGLARALRHRFLAFYCMMMIGMLAYAFSSSGALAWVFPDIDNNARLRMNYVLLATTGIAAINFLRHFFEVRVVSVWLGRQIDFGAIMLAGSAIAVATLAPWHLKLFDRAYSLSFALLLYTIVPLMISAWRQKSEFLWLFVCAWSAPIVLATLRTAFGLNLIGYNFWLDNSTILSMAFEALLSSLAIAYRILLITRERDAAREQEIAARMLADVDPLTGLMNRRAFLREAIGRDTAQQLLLIDIDHFKRVNDTIGHDGGDEVLRVVARTLRAHALPGSLVARIGGEEFAIVTPGEAVIDPDALLTGFRAARMPFDLTITASIGACTGILQREPDWKAMYCAADRALFEAKASGRDRVRTAGALDPLAFAA